MNIGEIQKEYFIEPLEDPIAPERLAPEEPEEAPTRVPEREPEKQPAFVER